jgi:hypothetical protein
VTLLCSSRSLSAYSVLTHEAIIDLLWNSDIRPLLLQKYPQATEDQLKDAQAYAYGGAVIQDLGYYPFGSSFFSNLVHYVRSGDFVENLLNEANDINDYAFALGALSHYAADTTGHPAVNRAVAIEYPKLRAKYGNRVTYAQGKTEHVKTEFGFDVVQVANGRYAPQSYHDFIGFKVAKPLLQRAFYDTYGLTLGDVLTHEGLAVGTYRHAISKTIPHMTKVALATRKDKIVREHPNFNRNKFLYNLSRADYEKSWGNEYERPGFGARILSFVLRLVPKIGPLKAVQYKDPTPATEDLYFKSVNSTVTYYHQLLAQLRSGKVDLVNRDFDTGQETRAGEYALTDDAYADLVQRINDNGLAGIDGALRDNVLTFYASDSAPNDVKRDPERWTRLQTILTQLRTEKAAVREPSHSATEARGNQPVSPH